MSTSHLPGQMFEWPGGPDSFDWMEVEVRDHTAWRRTKRGWKAYRIHPALWHLGSLGIVALGLLLFWITWVSVHDPQGRAPWDKPWTIPAMLIPAGLAATAWGAFRLWPGSRPPHLAFSADGVAWVKGRKGGRLPRGHAVVLEQGDMWYGRRLFIRQHLTRLRAFWVYDGEERIRLARFQYAGRGRRLVERMAEATGVPIDEQQSEETGDIRQQIQAAIRRARGRQK